MKRDFRPGVGAETVVKRYVSEWFDVRARVRTRPRGSLGLYLRKAPRENRRPRAKNARSARKTADSCRVALLY